MGPTASGKTALAIELRKVLPVELISVDSALIYRGMDIGTAKPNADELKAAPHRLLDIRDPSQAYSAADFRRDALEQMAEIAAAFSRSGSQIPDRAASSGAWMGGVASATSGDRSGCRRANSSK